MTIVATLLSGVLPGFDALAAAEMYDDPPELAPMPEEEPLIEHASGPSKFFGVANCCGPPASGVAELRPPIYVVPVMASVSMGKGARNSFTFSICRTGRARCAARKLVSGVTAIPA